MLRTNKLFRFESKCYAQTNFSGLNLNDTHKHTHLFETHRTRNCTTTHSLTMLHNIETIAYILIKIRQCYSDSIFIPLKRGIAFHTDMGPRELNCPNAISMKKSGKPASTSMTTYGTRKVAETHERVMQQNDTCRYLCKYQKELTKIFICLLIRSYFRGRFV